MRQTKKERVNAAERARYAWKRGFGAEIKRLTAQGAPIDLEDVIHTALQRAGAGGHGPAAAPGLVMLGKALGRQQQQVAGVSLVPKARAREAAEFVRRSPTKRGA